MKKVVIAIILIMNFNIIYGQSVVLNEYYNAVSNQDEWIELLVVQDVTSLVGYSLIDGLNENGEVNKWAGGIQFKDNILWKNLRQGTVIVINFRNNNITDKNKNDGFIQVDAEDETYFQKISFNGIWKEVALNVDNNCDIFQLINSQGIPEHSIGHSRNRDDLKIDIQSPFLISSNNCMINSVIAVLPGKDLTDYRGGFDDNKIKLITDSQYITKGLPNKNPLYYNTNGSFWKKLRQPVWDNPVMTANIMENSVDLFWNSCNDNFPSDLTVGYLIIRYNIKDVDSVEHPKDGTTYQKGEFIGKAIVVDNDANSLTTSYSDNFSFDCNDVYRYRIYAYRFGTDDLLGNKIDETYERGRVYNAENYAEVLVSKRRPIIPKIIIEGDTTFCEGDSVKLVCEAPGGPFQYSWFIDSIIIPISNKKEIYVKKTGLYKVRITNEKGCYSESDEVYLIQLPTPHSEIMVNENLITKDTLIEVCKGESIELSLSGGDRYEWFKDNILMTTGTDRITVNQDGEYFGVAINDGLECSDTTFKVKLNVLDIDYTFDQDTLYYYLDKFTPFEDKSLEVENLGSDTLEFLDIVLPPGGIFSVFAPVPSLVINPKSIKEYKVRFEPDRSGSFLDSISFISPCLDSEKKVYINAYKEPLDIALKPNILKFPDKIECDKGNDTLSFMITNNEDISLSVTKPFISGDFNIINNNFPYKLVGKDSLELQITFNANNPGFYDELVELKLISENGVKEKLYIRLQGIVKKVDFQVLFHDSSFSEIKFEDLIGCEDTAYTQIKIINTGEVDLNVADNTMLSEIYFPQLPLSIKSGDEKIIDIFFVPETQGNFDKTVDLLIQPCDFTKTIRFLGNKNGISYKVTQNSVDFGQILNCKDSTPIMLDDSIIVSGVAQDSAYIEKIIGPKTSAFTIDLIEGMNLLDTNTFQISFERMPIGVYYDTVEIKLQPCDVTKIVYLRGERTEPIISFSSDTINFGKLTRGKSDTLDLTVYNSGTIDFELQNISQLTYPFELINTYSGLLKAGDSIGVKIVFSPQEEGFFKDSVAFTIEIPCNIKKQIIILGEGIKPKDVKGIMLFGDDIYCFPGDEIKIPINFDVTNEVELDEVNLTSFEFELNYNFSLLYPIGVELNGMLTNLNTESINFKEISPGKLKLEVVLADQEKISEGKLFDVSFLVLLGDALRTDISADNFTFNSDVKFNVSSDKIEVIIKDENDISNKLIMYNNFKVFLQQNSIFGNSFNLVIDSETNDDFNIDIYNVTGETIISKRLTLNSGINEVSISSDGIQGGIYFIKITNKSFFKVCKVIIFR